ncbi:MAG: SMR family transporter [Verrucomicrobiota bacterium]
MASSSLVETFWNFVELFREPMIWLVCLVFGAAVALWILALSSIRLSVAYPVQTALVFVLTGLASYVFFHEAISLKMAFGYLLIIGGITLVSV